MNSTYIWILVPGIVAMILLLLMKWRTLTALIAAATSIILAGLAAWLPAQEQLVVWRWSLPFSDTFTIFGRQFVLSAGDRPALIVLYLAAALWFAAVPVARPTRLFTPLGLGIIALLTAAIAVEPFLFAAVIIEIAVLISIPILSVPGRRAGQGVLRYLAFQTLGMPFLLISGFLFSGFESGPGEPVFVAIATAMLVIGFALLLAVFPFHTWIPMMAEETHPYQAAFIFLLLPISVLFLGLGFLDNFSWMGDDANTVLLIQVLGAVMVVTAGFWGAVERYLSRMIGFAVILDIGFSLLTISLVIGDDTGLYRNLFFTGLIVRGLSLGVLALSMSVLLDRIETFEIVHLRGLGKRMPVIAISLIAGLLSLAGAPVFAGFPFKLGTVEGVSALSPAVSVWVLLGAFGLVVGTTRVLLSLVSDENEGQELAPEPRLVIFYLLIGVGVLFLIGLLPNYFLQLFTSLPAVFGGQ